MRGRVAIAPPYRKSTERDGYGRTALHLGPYLWRDIGDALDLLASDLLDLDVKLEVLKSCRCSTLGKAIDIWNIDAR